jgi:hypothetical protein
MGQGQISHIVSIQRVYDSNHKIPIHLTRYCQEYIFTIKYNEKKVEYK